MDTTEQQSIKETYSLDEAAAYLIVSVSSIIDLIATGELAAAKISKSYVLRGVTLRKYLADQERIQTSQRRESYMTGKAVRIETAVSIVRKNRRCLPELPALPKAA